MSKWTVVEFGFDCFALVDPNGTRIVAMSGLVGNDRLNALAARLNAADEYEHHLLECRKLLLQVTDSEHSEACQAAVKAIDATLGKGKE